MTADLRARWPFLKAEVTVQKVSFFVLVLVLTPVLWTLEHLNSHLDMPFLDGETLLAGSMYIMLISLLFAGQAYYVANQKMARAALVDLAKDLEQQVLVGTADLHLQAQLIDSAMDSIFLLDMEGNCIYANQAAFQTRG